MKSVKYVNSLSDAYIPNEDAKGFIFDKDYTGSNFENAIFDGCTMSYFKAVFCRYYYSNFRGASLKGVNATTFRADHSLFDGANMSKSDFCGSSFAGASLVGVNASDSDFSGAQFRDADLSCINMLGSDFSGAMFNTCSFAGANINANIDNAMFIHCDFMGAEFDFTRFSKLSKVGFNGGKFNRGDRAKLEKAGAIFI